MKKIIFTLCLIFSIHSFVSAQVWHVSASGNDHNDGKTMATAFRSLQKAADLVKPGDVVLIGNGIYTTADKSSNGAVLSIVKSGTRDAWITYKAEPGQRPEIRPIGWSGIQITGSYNVIDGITVIGANDSIYLAKAQQDAKKTTPDASFNTNGIFVTGRPKGPGEKPHHNIIRNCTVGKCPGGGIIGIETDYFTIEDCNVYENAWFMRYGGSGISTLQNWAYDEAPGYHNIFRRNYVFNNKTMVPWEKIGGLSDGNGIIMDVSDQEQNGATNPNADAVVKPIDAAPAPAKPKRPEWKGRTLIANNVCAFNGGSGIHTFRTKYVDIINNTTYHNGAMVGYPEVFANSSEDIVFLNNIIVPRPAGKVTSSSAKNKNITWNYNLHPIAQEFFTAPNDIIADPQFINASEFVNRLSANFHVKAGSPALGSGVDKTVNLSITDLVAKPKKGIKGKKINRGAYAF